MTEIEVSAKKIYDWPISTQKDVQHHQSLGKCNQNCNEIPLMRQHKEITTSKKIIISADEEVEKLESSYTADGDVKQYSCCTRQFGNFSKS